MPRLNMYVDGFNLYHSIDDLGDPKLKWTNIATLAKSFLVDGEVLGDVHFFTTVVDWEPGKKRRHEEYIKAQEASGVIVTQGKFKKTDKHCPVKKIMCAHREEKQTDVSIAVTMIADAFDGKFDRAVLVTADTDQIPTIKLLAQRFPQRPLYWAAPPGRMHMAREIGSLFDPKNRTEITAGRLSTCKLPKVVLDIDGTALAYRPKEYD